MHYRRLGRTDIEVSAIAFGAGPVSGLLTGDDDQRQHAVIEHALRRGINWIDTAAGYGEGRSERNLGRCLAAISIESPVHVATKVRIPPEQADAPGEHIRRSVMESIERLGREQVTLLQVHNALTQERGAEPAAITPQDVLRPGGVADALEQLKSDGLARLIGLTGTGEPSALREVIRSGRFDTLQTPYHLLNQSAHGPAPANSGDRDYGRIIDDCAKEQMGVFAIRVFAAGALLGTEPSAHTRITPYFPLALFEQDRKRAAELQRQLGGEITIHELATRFVLSNPLISAAIIGFGSPAEVDVACSAAEAGALSDPVLGRILHFACE